MKLHKSTKYRTGWGKVILCSAYVEAVQSKTLQPWMVSNQKSCPHKFVVSCLESLPGAGPLQDGAESDPQCCGFQDSWLVAYACTPMPKHVVIKIEEGPGLEGQSSTQSRSIELDRKWLAPR